MYGREAKVQFRDEVPLAVRLRVLADIAEACGDDALLLRYDDMRNCSLVALSPSKWHSLVIELRNAQVSGQLMVLDPPDIAILAKDVEELRKESR